MKIALVHDQLNEFGGAERVLLAMSELYPDAPIHTAYYREGSPAWERFKEKDVRTSWAQHIPGFARMASPLRFLASSIWNTFDFAQYDVIIGSSSWYVTKGFAKKGPSTLEICYCHTPPRWLYGYPTSVNWQKYPIVRAYATIVGFFMRQYDFNAAQRVDHFIANSKETQSRIQKFYRRDSTVIYPPVELPSVNVSKLQRVKKEEYYLFVSRPVGGKGLEQAIAATSKLGVPLKIVGIKGAPHVSDSELAELYAGAKAFLALATDEDFGITPVEAMSYGTPVIAYAGGGYIESVIDGKTGVLFTGDLVAAIKKFETMKIDPKACIAQAKKFSKERFKKELKEFVEHTLSLRAKRGNL